MVNFNREPERQQNDLTDGFDRMIEVGATQCCGSVSITWTRIRIKNWAGSRYVSNDTDPTKTIENLIFSNLILKNDYLFSIYRKVIININTQCMGIGFFKSNF